MNDRFLGLQGRDSSLPARSPLLQLRSSPHRRGRACPALHPISVSPLFFHPHRESLRPNSPHASVGADSISIRPHTFISISHFPATPPRRSGALLRPCRLPLYDLLTPKPPYAHQPSTARGISPALKTARGAVFAPRYADAWPGLFDFRTGHHLRPTPIEKQIQRKKHYLK